MTLQQLEYIVTLDKYRHFGKAADACGITQSTLSAMVQKLENELDLIVFDRNSRPLQPTLAGTQMIAQAKVVLFNAQQLEEQARQERQQVTGKLDIGLTPTIAPYVVPKLFKYVRENHPGVNIHAFDVYREEAIAKLIKAELDVVIMSLPHGHSQLLEIPIYRERMLAYVSPKCPLYGESCISTFNMPDDHLWCLKEECKLLHDAGSCCDDGPKYTSRYEAGSIVTLMMIVNENGGMTVIPELHREQLREEYQQHIRPMVDPVPEREVSFFIRRDFVREGLLNVLAEAVKSIIPESMLNERIKKFPIKL